MAVGPINPVFCFRKSWVRFKAAREFSSRNDLSSAIKISTSLKILLSLSISNDAVAFVQSDWLTSAVQEIAAVCGYVGFESGYED